MKKSIISTLIAVVMCIPMVNAQETQLSYNLSKALELIKENNDVEAKKYVEQEIEQSPKSSDAQFLASVISNRGRQINSAIAYANKALSLHNKKSFYGKEQIYVARAQLYTKVDEYQKALADYDAAFKGYVKEKNINNACRALSDKAEIYYYLDDMKSAEDAYLQILKYDEADIVAMAGLMRNMLKRGDFDGVVAMGNKCEKYAPDYSEIYCFRMQAYNAMAEVNKAVDDAISYYEYCEEPRTDWIAPIFKKNKTYSLAKVKAKINEGADSEMWKWFKITLNEMFGDYLNAITGFNEYEREYGASILIYYYRSRCYGELGDFQSAIADINRCIEMGDGNDKTAVSARADYYRLDGQYEAAIADFTKEIEYYPLSAYGYYKRGWCYEFIGDDNSALKDYNTGIEVDQSYPYIYLNRGELYLKRGETELAIADFNEILSIDTIPSSGSCRQYALLHLGRNEEALEWMDSMIVENDYDKGDYYDKACLLSRMGKVEESVKALKDAFEAGYRSFTHIENDDDLDNIRNHPEYIALMKKYDTIVIGVAEPAYIDSVFTDSITTETISEVPMKKLYSGVYEVSCKINELPLKFILDTGASIVTLSSVEAAFMMKNGYLSENDIKGAQRFSMANGDFQEGTRVVLKEIKIGDAVLKNIEATVVKNQQAPLLLGQSVMDRFGTITIDNINSKLIIKQYAK